MSFKDNIKSGSISKEIQVQQPLRDRFLAKDQGTGQLLRLYQQILVQGEVELNGSWEQAELLKLALVAKIQDKLILNRKSPILDLHWVEQQLFSLLPNNEVKRRLLKLERKAESLDRVLAEVHSWTGKQPLLNDKLYQLIVRSSFIAAGEEKERVEQLVQTHIINDWETGTAAKQLKEIRDRLLNTQKYEPFWLLRKYQQILQQGDTSSDASGEETELLRIGLVTRQAERISVSNRIYSSIFNARWVEDVLFNLRPYEKLRRELDEKADSPFSVIEAVLVWTNRHRYLTATICQLLCDLDKYIEFGQEASWVEQVVWTHIIDSWRQGAAAEHLQAVSDRVLERGTGVLDLYRQLLQQGELATNSSQKQAELLELGLVVEHQEKLVVANRIYQSVFNLDWLEQTSSQGRTPSLMSLPTLATSATVQSKKKRSWQILALAIALVGAGWGVGQRVLKNLEVQTLFNQGNQLLQQREYQAAIDKYNQVLRIDANYYQAWTNWGYALASLGNYDQMLNSCRSATYIEPRATYAWNCQGEAFYNLKQFEEAVTAFDRAIALDSTDPAFFINKSSSLLASDRPDEALVAIERAITLIKERQSSHTGQDNPELAIALSTKGRIKRESLQYQEAFAIYEQALNYQPDYFPAQRDRALVLKALGRYDQARAAFDKLLNNTRLADAQKAEIWFYQGLTLCQLSETEAALTALDQALQLKPNYKAAQKAKLSCAST